MNQESICPRCGKSFHDEDYCPVDGTPLVPAVAAASPEEPTAPATASNSGEEHGSDNAGLSDHHAPRGRTEEESGDQRRSENRLADFMSRLGLRRVSDKETPRYDDPEAAPAQSNEPASPLPEAVREQGWRISGPVQTSPGLDHWPVERIGEAGERMSGDYNRFRTGALTTDMLYRRLEARSTPRLARVWAHGTADLGGARSDYELVSVAKAGRRLSHWFVDTAPSEQRAWHLFAMLVEMLRQLSAVDIRPLTLEPSQLILSDGGELWLATAAVLADTTAANEYRPELDRSALLPPGWTAPELGQQNLISANAAVFSLGQLLAMALWGQPCSPSDLQHGAVPFKSIRDARLARVLMGCLWPRPLDRWTLEHLVQSVAAAGPDAMPATPPWDSLAPGACSTAFSFAGSSYWRLETLLADAVEPANWSEASARLQSILDWAEETAWIGQAKLLRSALAQGRSADWALVALTRAVRPDLPLTWRGLDLSDAEAARSLAGLAQRALRGEAGNAETMRALFEADLRGAWTQIPPQS
jgi:hypothetical protein